MMQICETTLQWIAVAAVGVRVLCIAANNNKAKWGPHGLRFIGFAAGYALGGTGTVTLACGYPIGGTLVALAFAILVLSEWRLEPRIHHD